MGSVRHSPFFEEFFGDYLGCSCPICQPENGVDVESVSFDSANGNIYVVVKLTDGYTAPVRLTTAQINQLRKLLKEAGV